MILSLLFSGFFAMSQDTTAIMNERINLLDQKVNAYKTIYDEKFNIKSKEIDLKLYEFESDYNWLGKLFAGSAIVLIVITTVIWFYNLPKKINEIAERKANEMLGKIFEAKSLQFKEIVAKYDEDESLKRRKKILVLHQEKNDEIEFLKNFFRSNGFSDVGYVPTQGAYAITEDYDILFLFNEDATFTNDINEFITQLKPNKILFNFGQGINMIHEKKYFCSANFRSQLYGNLMSALKYQNTIS